MPAVPLIFPPMFKCLELPQPTRSGLHSLRQVDRKNLAGFLSGCLRLLQQDEGWKVVDFPTSSPKIVWLIGWVSHVSHD